MVDHEIALEEALQRIGGDDQSDDDSEDNISGYDAGEDMPKSYTENGCSSTHYTAPQPRPLTLRQILDDERSFQLFSRFLKDQCISRNLKFWLSCEYYRFLPPNNKTKLLETAKAVYVKYLKSSAPLHVSISENARKYIQVIINVQCNPDPSLFQQAQQEVYQQMEANELRQFLLSDNFSDCTQFNSEDNSHLVEDMAALTFKPSQYHVGSVTGSDDSTSVTSFASEDAAHTVLYVPPVTRSAYTPRNAHSDTENSSRSRHRPFPHYTRTKHLTQNDFYDVLCDRLTAVNKDRANMKQRAQNLARMNGKSYEEIMALEWYDAPEAIKYVRFEEDDPAYQADGYSSSDRVSPNSTHQDIVSQISCPLVLGIAAKEIQEAVKELEITRQVRQKRSTMSSSASSYVSDSGIASESLLPSSRGGGGCLPRPTTGRRVQDYVQTQNTLTSQLSERDQQAQIAATLLMNNSVPKDEINPTYATRRYGNYPHLGGSPSDDSSSCFTGTSMSSNSEFFVPRRPHQPQYFPESEDSRHNRYPGRRPKRSQPPRFVQNPVSHTSTRAMSPAILNNPLPPTTVAIQQPPHPQPPTQAPPTTTAPSNSSTLLVVYTMDGKANTMCKRVNNTSMTLADFKEKVFARQGSYRFFFKMYCEEMGSDMMEEISDEGQTLPFYGGKIIGHVELVD